MLGHNPNSRCAAGVIAAILAGVVAGCGTYPADDDPFAVAQSVVGELRASTASVVSPLSARMPSYAALRPSDAGYIVTPASPVRVVDGDTAHFSVTYPSPHEEVVRFLGVDTPEAGSCYAGDATGYTSSFVSEGPVSLVCESSSGDYHRDGYGRALCYVYSADMTRSLNEELLRGGYAAGFFAYPFEFRAQYTAMEAGASSGLVGLWGACPSGGAK